MQQVDQFCTVISRHQFHLAAWGRCFVTKYFQGGCYFNRLNYSQRLGTGRHNATHIWDLRLCNTFGCTSYEREGDGLDFLATFNFPLYSAFIAVNIQFWGGGGRGGGGRGAGRAGGGRAGGV